MDSGFRHLLSLLDDENEQSASLAMAELLERDQKQLEPVLRKLQETPDMRLRRRVHQLQSAITLRKRRKSLTESLSERNMELLEGLVQIHLLWFDNDSREGVRAQWEQLEEEASKASLRDIEDIASFMIKKNFTCSNRDEMDAEYFCIGTVLDEFIGADFIVCCIAMLIGEASGIKLRITQSTETDFLLVDDYGTFLLPNEWKVIHPPEKSYSFQAWTSEMLLRYAGALLFTCSVCTDSFRYVYTIGSCLAEDKSTDKLDFLPYPYSTGGKR